MLKDGLGTFLLASNRPGAREPLVRSWEEIGRQTVPASERLSAKELAIQGIRHEDALCAFIRFPNRAVEGEIAFGAVVARPINFAAPSSDWAAIPYRYWGLVFASGGTSVVELTDGERKQVGVGPVAEAEAFVDWIMKNMVPVTGLGTIAVEKGDEETEMAVRRARQTLAKMLDAFASGELADCDFSLKIPLTNGKQTEHMWIREIECNDGMVSGILSDPPRVITTVREGDRCSARMEDVEDWMYVREGRLYGNYTLRALLPRMPKEKAEELANRLAPLPSVEPPPLPENQS